MPCLTYQPARFDHFNPNTTHSRSSMYIVDGHYGVTQSVRLQDGAGKVSGFIILSKIEGEGGWANLKWNMFLKHRWYLQLANVHPWKVKSNEIPSTVHIIGTIKWLLNDNMVNKGIAIIAIFCSLQQSEWWDSASRFFWRYSFTQIYWMGFFCVVDISSEIYCNKETNLALQSMRQLPSHLTLSVFLLLDMFFLYNVQCHCSTCFLIFLFLLQSRYQRHVSCGR